MAESRSTLRIGAENLGTVAQLKNFLTDLENAYNSIYTFDLICDIVDSSLEKDKMFLSSLKELKDWRLYDYFYSHRGSLPSSLLELLNRVRAESSIPLQDQLILSKIVIQSPGFWEMLGALSPLQQIREYMKDRHERKKDRNFKEEQEKIRGEIDILNQRESLIQKRIETLKAVGYSDNEIRQVVTRLINEPLSQLGQYQDTGLITIATQDMPTNDSDANQDRELRI